MNILENILLLFLVNQEIQKYYDESEKEKLPGQLSVAKLTSSVR